MFNILSLLVGFLYCTRYFCDYKKFFVVALEGLTPYLLGGLIIAYGIFRIIRAIIF